MYTIRYTYDYSVPSGWPQHPYKNAAGDVPGAPVMYTQPQDPEDVGAGYGYSNAEGFTEDVFFYHSDHLGSTSYVTDGDGNATQFVAYTPFGETLVDEHAVTFETPYKFNGKEMDAETGLYYYGARYYDPSLALWYGVDALAEKYPSLGGYVYCANNPVRLIDPDGKEVGWVVNGEGEISWNDNAISQGTTPVGYEFIGNDDKSLLNYFHVQTSSTISSTAVSVIPMDPKVAHPICLTSKSTLSAKALITEDCSQVSDVNTKGNVFTGLELEVVNATRNTGSSEGSVSMAGVVDYNFDNFSYTDKLSGLPQGAYFLQSDTYYTRSTLSLSAKSLKQMGKVKDISVKGSWVVSTAGGKVPVGSFDHSWQYARNGNAFQSLKNNLFDKYCKLVNSISSLLMPRF